MRIQNYSLILGEKGIKLLRNAEKEGILEGRNWERGHGGSYRHEGCGRGGGSKGIAISQSHG